MIASLIPYVIAIAGAFSAGWAVNGWRADAALSNLKQTQAQAVAKGVSDALKTTVDLQGRKDAALAAATKRNRDLAATAASARAESIGLRVDLSRARADLAQHSGSPGDCDTSASGALLDVLEQGIERLAEQGTRIAGLADSHHSDVLTLKMSWPK